MRLRTSAFGKAATLAGFRADYRLAQVMEVNQSTVTRVVVGSLQPGPTFISRALTALAPLDFANLFEVARRPRPVCREWSGRSSSTNGLDSR